MALIGGKRGARGRTSEFEQPHRQSSNAPRPGSSSRQTPSCPNSAQPSSTLDALQRFATSATTQSGRFTPRMSPNGMRLYTLVSRKN
jgi:hypothetical protein